MISMVIPLHVGNALRLFIEPIANAVDWKVLRKGSGTFSAHDDPTALLVYRGDEKVIVDDNALPNGVLQYYCAFYTTDGIAWIASEVASGTANAIYDDQSTDVLETVRDRLAAGLKVECERGTFATTELGYLSVVNAPPVFGGELRWPLVSVHVDNENSSERAIGEHLQSDDFDTVGGDWQESDGWLANVRLNIIGWSLNADERITLRKAIRRIIVANLPVFESHGMLQMDLSMQDVDSVNGEYPALVYSVVSTFSCVAPVRVTGKVPAITDLIVENLSA